MWKASEKATSVSPLSTRRRESIWVAGHEERFARVRFTTLPPRRRHSRRRMAGGESRLGTDSTYMGIERGAREGTNPDELLVDEGFNAILGGIIQKKFGLNDPEHDKIRHNV